MKKHGIKNTEKFYTLHSKIHSPLWESAMPVSLTDRHRSARWGRCLNFDSQTQNLRCLQDHLGKDVQNQLEIQSGEKRRLKIQLWKSTAHRRD